MKQKGLLVCTLIIIYGSLRSVCPASPGTPIWDIAADVKERACTIESKVCEFDFTDVSTVIDGIIEKECTLSSQIDALQQNLETVVFDFDGTFTSLQALFETACTINSELDSPNSIVDAIQDAFGFPITNQVVGANGFTITEGGEYYLAENIVFEPSSTGLAAITINADNTFINFKSKTLSTDGTSDTIGVELVASHTNVRIFNGVIADTTAQGILLNENSANVSIEHMTIKDVSAESGIELMLSSTDIFFTNVTAVNCNEHGILADDSSSIILRNCVCSDNGNGTGNGVSFTDCSEVSLSNCTANNNTDQGLGFSSTTTSENITLFECTTWDNGEHGILFENIADSVIMNGFSKGNSSDGIHLIDALRITIANNCCESNGRDNIRLATASTGTQNCYIGQNSLVLTTSINLREESGSFENGVFGNFALAQSSANNYVSIGGGSVFNSAVIAQDGAFPTPEPTFWNNISMTTT